MAVATFGAGCFWGVEAAFRSLPGVSGTAVGYSGGATVNPTYEDVCTDRTGHAEVVQVEYDPTVISYEQLLEAFWSNHNPTTLNRQGPDVGTQYRSAIYYHTPEQQAVAEASKKGLTESGRFPRPIVTEITPAAEFYRAEEYHQQYLEKRFRVVPHLDNRKSLFSGRACPPFFQPTTTQQSNTEKVSRATTQKARDKSRR